MGVCPILGGGHQSSNRDVYAIIFDNGRYESVNVGDVMGISWDIVVLAKMGFIEMNREIYLMIYRDIWGYWHMGIQWVSHWNAVELWWRV